MSENKKSLRMSFIMFVIVWILSNFLMGYITFEMYKLQNYLLNLNSLMNDFELINRSLIIQYVIISIGWVSILFIGIRYIIHHYLKLKREILK